MDGLSLSQRITMRNRRRRKLDLYERIGQRENELSFRYGSGGRSPEMLARKLVVDALKFGDSYNIVGDMIRLPVRHMAYSPVWGAPGYFYIEIPFSMLPRGPYDHHLRQAVEEEIVRQLNEGHD